MKKLALLVFLVIFIITACGNNDSKPLPTQPAANFPTLAPDTLPLCQSSDLDESSNADSSANKVVMGMTLINKTQHIAGFFHSCSIAGFFHSCSDDIKF